MDVLQEGTQLPAGVADALRAIVGTEHVLTTPEALDAYSRCTIPWRTRCAAVIFPASTEEVAQAVKVAARHGIALWPSSKGRRSH